MANKSYKEITEEIAFKSKRLTSMFDETPPHEMTREQAEQVKQWNDELTALGEERDTLKARMDIEAKARAEYEASTKPAGGLILPSEGSKGYAGNGGATKSLAERIAETAAYKAWEGGGPRAAVGMGPLAELSVSEFKTLVTLTTVSPQNQRLARIEPLPVEERTVADLMPEGTMRSNSFEYYEHTSRTNAAATVAEGGTKPEGAIGLTLRTATARKIAEWMPVTDEALADNEWLEGFIRGQLVFGVQREEEEQILTGSGTGTNLTGLLNTSGIQTQAKGSDATPTAIYLAMTKIRSIGFAEPNAIVMHPNDAASIFTLQAADGTYIWGHPAQAITDRIWSLPVRQTTAMTENTALVADFRRAQVFRRTGITVTASTEHSTYYVENKVALMAEERIALAVYRPTAFCTVTGI